VHRAVLAVAACLLLAACNGGSSGSSSSSTSSPGSATAATTTTPTLAAILHVPVNGGRVDAANVLVPSGKDFQSGIDQRVSLGLLGKDGSGIDADGGVIDVYLAPRSDAVPLGPFPAREESVMAPGAPTDSPLQSTYIAHVKVPQAGTYFIAARFELGGKTTTASGPITIHANAATAAVGALVPRSQTPTLASTRGDLKALTTAAPPDTSLLRYSIAGSIAAHVPFVVTFATPAFCQSRICGPTVSVVQEAQRRLKGTPLRFIHVEIYEHNTPPNPNQWVLQWKLPSEPWVFVVGADGRLKAKFEGAVGVNEVVAAARAALAQ
jgi:hypothetical protein